MKKMCLSLVFLVSICLCSYAQSDTMYRYYSKSNKEIISDSAFVYLKIYPKDSLWFGQEFYKKNNKLRFEGSFIDKDAKKPVGTFKNFKEDGSLDYIADWNDGKLVSKNYFYKNGNKKSQIVYGDKVIVTEKGWDENGNEMKNYVVEREARFKGGMEGWKRYLEKHLNASVAGNAGAPVGNYTVKVQFVVSKEGIVSNVKTVSIPAHCKACADEAVSVIVNGPEWEPAIQNNEPVLYQAIQYITFQVAKF